MANDSDAPELELGSLMTLSDYIMDFSPESNRIYSIFHPYTGYENIPNSEIRKYEYESLNFQGVIDISPFKVPSINGDLEDYKSAGYFGFFIDTGSQFYVIAKIETGAESEVLKEWATAIIETE